MLAALAGRLVATRGWERLGFARARDYAVERLGLSARSLQDLARVDAALARLPTVECELVSGSLTWTKARLVCRVAEPEDAVRWLALARASTARALAREVRAVDVGALEAGAIETDEDGALEERRECVRIRCSPLVQAKWHRTRNLARRVAGEALPTWEAMEAVAAELLSAFPLDREAADETATETDETIEPRLRPLRAANGCAAHTPADEPLPSEASEPPPFLAALLDGLETIDAFELDARLRRAVVLEQRLESELGTHLLEVAERRGYLLHGLRSMELYAREALGVSPRKARGLLRMARIARSLPAVHEAWSGGRISWAQAQTILPRVAEAPDRAAFWIERATSVSVRRLEEDVEAHDRQTGAPPMDDEATPAAEPESCEVFWIGPADAARLLRGTLCSMRRRFERATGRLPTPGQAFEAMLDHAFLAWGGDERRVQAAWRVFARDGWRCTVPGCSSYRNLHSHHIQHRSAGGSDEDTNRTTLCAWHHLRGVHAGRVRIRGRAPDGLVIELGVRAGAPSLLISHGSEELRR